MKKPILCVSLAMLALSALSCDQSTEAVDPTDAPPPALQYTADGNLIRPEDYREWIFLSSGIGMTYSETPPDDDPPFGNVFVHPAAYRRFVSTGTWPDRTIFVVEVRASTSHGSINLGGHYQTDLLAIEAEVKDAARFPDKWSYFGFAGPDGTLTPDAKAKPNETCFNCHAKSAAVDNTFVQFYPTLLEVAKSKGTLRSDYPQ